MKYELLDYQKYQNRIEEILGDDIEFFDGSPRLAIHLKEVLKEKNLINEKNDGKIIFYDSKNDYKKEERFFSILNQK